MQITKDNVGDTLCLYQSAEHIKILDVTSRYVVFAQEDGTHYVNAAHTADAFPITDPDRVASFERNYSLGKVLNAAKTKAVELVADGRHRESREASSVLRSVRSQLNHLISRMNVERAQASPGKALAQQFLSQLSSRTAGSHDTFWGHKVWLLSNWTYDFQIDGKKMDYSTAVSYLSKIRLVEQTKNLSLSDKIAMADARRTRNNGSEHRSLNQVLSFKEPDR